MLDREGFLLYDALLSLIMLATMTSFFLLVINNNIEHTQKIQLKIKEVEALRDEAYYYADHGTYYEKNYNDFILEKKNGGVCAKTLQNEICV